MMITIRYEDSTYAVHSTKSRLTLYITYKSIMIYPIAIGEEGECFRFSSSFDDYHTE